MKAVKTAAKRIPKRWRPLVLVTGAEYEDAIAGAPPAREWQPRRPVADDRVLIYTGGTTGPTIALMWRSGDLYDAMRERTQRGRAASVDLDLVTEEARDASVLPVIPLTHTLGLFPALATLVAAGTLVLVETDPFDPAAVWDAVQHECVAVLYPGAERQAGRLLEALDATPAQWDLSGLRTIDASDAPLSETTRLGLDRHLPAAHITRPSPSVRTIGDRHRVVDELTGADVEPGSGQVGLFAVAGPVPLGYFKDLDKTASQFRVIDGVRYLISGEHTTVDAAGVVRRADGGSATIRRGQTLISAPAVEITLRKHPSVEQCVVVERPGSLGRRSTGRARADGRGPRARRSGAGGVVPRPPRRARDPCQGPVRGLPGGVAGGCHGPGGAPPPGDRMARRRGGLSPARACQIPVRLRTRPLTLANSF